MRATRTLSVGVRQASDADMIPPDIFALARKRIGTKIRHQGHPKDPRFKGREP